MNYKEKLINLINSIDNEEMLQYFYVFIVAKIKRGTPWSVPSFLIYLITKGMCFDCNIGLYSNSIVSAFSGTSK